MTDGTEPPVWRSAAIVAVGSELLTPTRIDTNSLYLTEQLNAIGVEVVAKGVVGDDHQAVADAFRHAESRADLVVMTGGLGPTDDDVTREAVAAALDLPLEEDPAIVALIERRFAARGLEMPAINRRQALVPRGAQVLDNPNGTAPGLWLQSSDSSVLLLPGPPSELKPMFEGWCKTVVGARGGVVPIHRRSGPHHGPDRVARRRSPPAVLRILAARPAAGRGDDPGGDGPDRVAPVGARRCRRRRATRWSAPRPTSGPRSATTSSATTERRWKRSSGTCSARAAGRWRLRSPARAAWCRRGSPTLPAARTTCSSRSCLYSNASKIDVLSVPPDLIEVHGAVSEQVAAAMATGARERAHAHVGLGITGVAGPGGGTTRKPVGTVAIAVVGPDGASRVRMHKLRGNRQQIKTWAAQVALDSLRRMLLKRSG